MSFPANLIKAYRAGEITRAEFCRRYSKMQGFDGSVKSLSTSGGLFFFYRGRVISYNEKKFTWDEKDCRPTASSLKETKIIIDIYKMTRGAHE